MAEIRLITPRGLEVLAEKCIIEKKPLEETRALLLAEHTKLHPPVGTPELKDEEKPKASKLKNMSDNELTHALCG